MLKIDGCHFCLFSVEVLMEFISSPILKKETLVKAVAVIERDSPVGWTAQGLLCLNYKRFGLDGIFLPSS